MRAIGIVVMGSVAVALVLPVFAANPLSSADFRRQFGTGAPITGTAIPGGASYELTLAPDGAAAMKSLQGDKSLRTGAWRVSQTGYCSTWAAAAVERCYMIVRNGKAYDVVNDVGKVVARWTR